MFGLFAYFNKPTTEYILPQTDGIARESLAVCQIIVKY
jgi:hypothetical protein